MLQRATSLVDLFRYGSTMTARRAISASILLLLSASLFAIPRAEDELPTATVLCYHIVEAPSAPRMQIGRDTFIQHLRYIEMTGYNVIPLEHLYEYVIGKRKSIPKNSIVITIDDGWRSTYTEAFPELQARKFPFTVFIYPNIIGKTANALTWDQIREMSEAGVDIQSHALTHPFLTRRKQRSMSDENYRNWLQKELVESRRILEKQSGKKVRFLAYPYGDYDDDLAKATAKAGYLAALTCDFGPVRRGSDPLKMKRVVIDDTMSFAAFRRYLGTKPLQLAEMTPSPGEAVRAGTTRITARIKGYEALDPSSVGMALLSFGKTIPYSYDARNGEITLKLQRSIGTMKSRHHRAIVWGTDSNTGKRVEASWAFVLPSEKDPPEAETPQLMPVATVAATGGASGVTSSETGGSPKR